MPSTFAFVDGYEAVAQFPDGTVSRIPRGSPALRGWERALWKDAMGKPNRGGLSTQQAENIKRVLQKKDLPTKYDDVAEDEKARLEAVLTILTLRLAQLSDNHPSPAASATAQLEKQIQADLPNTELNDFQEQPYLAGANHPAAHPEFLLRETTLVPRATQRESTTQCAVPKESAIRGFVLPPSQDDRTMRSSNPVFWPVKAADLVVFAGYTAMNVGGNYLYPMEPDMVLFMENGVKMPWPSHQMQARAELVLQWYFAHEWKVLTARQAEKLTESLQEWPPSVSISYFEASIYMCWWLKSVAYLYKLTGDSNNFKTVCRFVVEFDKECPAISSAIMDSWTRIMGEVLDIDPRPQTDICGETPIVTVDVTQVGLLVQRERLDPSQRCDFRQPGAQEAAPAETAQAETSDLGDKPMKQAKLRSKQKQRLRVLARTNFISTDTNRKSKKLSLDLTSILKPKGKISLHRRGVARRVFRSQAHATLEAMEKPTRKLRGTTTRKQDRDLEKAMRISLLAVVEQNDTATAPTPHLRQAENGTDTLKSGQDEDIHGDESTEKVSWLKAQEMYQPEEYDPDISHAIHEEIASTETEEEEYHDKSD